MSLERGFSILGVLTPWLVLSGLPTGMSRLVSNWFKSVAPLHVTFVGGDTKLADRVVFLHMLIDCRWVQLRVNFIECPTPLLIGRKTLSLLQARIDATKCEGRFAENSLCRARCHRVGKSSCSFGDRPGSLACRSWWIPIEETARPLGFGHSLVMETGTRHTCRRLFIPCMSRWGILIRGPWRRCLRSVFPGDFRSHFLRSRRSLNVICVNVAKRCLEGHERHCLKSRCSTIMLGWMCTFSGAKWRRTPHKQSTGRSGRTREQKPSGPGHRTRNTTHRAGTPVNRSQVGQDTAHAKQHTERAHR